VLAGGGRVTLELVRRVLASELSRLRSELGEAAFRDGHYEAAARLLERLTADPEFAPFLTLRAYEEID
jgi:malate synthase